MVMRSPSSGLTLITWLQQETSGKKIRTSKIFMSCIYDGINPSDITEIFVMKMEINITS